MKALQTALLVLVLVACTGEGGAGRTGPEDRTTTSLAGATTTAETSTTLPPTTSTPATDPVSERLAWLAGLLDGAPLAEGDYQGAVSNDFAANVPFQEFADLVAQVGASGSGWAVTEYEERGDFDAIALLAPDGGEPLVRAQIVVGTSVPHRIEGLLIQPATPPVLDDPPPDLDSAADRLAEHGELRLLAAEVVGGTCEPVLEISADEPAPVGSVAKLYVLGAVVEAVATGELAWDDQVEIEEALKSVPTGVLQDEEAGTEFSVREMAEAMIAFSDNTATDHLIHLVGRGAVEDAQEAYGHASPNLNLPFLTTRELTALKIGPASGLRVQWLDGDEGRRRAILDQISDITPGDLPVITFTEPVDPDTVEWFASPYDLCRALVALDAAGEPVDDVLSINPGIPDEGANFEEIRFKGGSEPGLVAMAWWVARPDGRAFVVAGSVVNPEEVLDELEVTLLFGHIRDLLADV